VLHWGRPLITSAARDDRPGSNVVVSVSSTELNQLGRRIGVAALGLAVVIPAVLPGLSDGVFGGGGTGDGSGSNRTIATLNALVTLRRDLTRSDDLAVLRVRTDAPSPGDLYLRTVTLDLFDGQDWRASSRRVQRFDTQLPAAQGLSPEVETSTIRSTVQVSEQLRSDYVPVPYPAQRVSIDGDWRVDPETQNLVSQRGREQISGRDYAVDSLLLSPTREQMLGSNTGGDNTAADPGVNRYLRLPRLPAAVENLATEITRGADTPLDRAVAIQSYLRDPKNFTYDLSVSSGTGTSAILDFLQERRGYCEQFASTMAVMARLVGIPARVNVGFTSGDLQDDGSLLITSHDAHAWPELYFPGVGWSRFEPTPSAASSGPSVPLWLASTTVTEPVPGATAPSGATSTASPSPSPGAAGACTGADRNRPGCRDVPEATGATPTQGSKAPLVLLAIALVGLVAAIPALMRVVTGWRRWARAVDPRGRAEAAWAQLRDDARDLGYGWSDAQTPRQVADRMAREGGLHGESTRALTRITRTVEYARYAPASAGWSMRPAADPRHDARRVRSALAAAAGRRMRMHAVLLPPSSMQMLGRAGGRIVDTLDAMEEAIARLRTRLRARLRTRRS